METFKSKITQNDRVEYEKINIEASLFIEFLA